MDRSELLDSWVESFNARIWADSPTSLREQEAGIAAALTSAELSLTVVFQELPDETLALAFQKGFLVREVFTELFVGRYERSLARWLFRWGADAERAAEVLQDLYLRFYENRLATYNPEKGFRGYLWVSARNLWVQHGRDTRAVNSLDSLQSLASTGPGPEQALADKEALERINAAIAGLPDLERAVLNATQAGKSADETAQALDLPKYRVYRLLFQARRRLEQVLWPTPASQGGGRKRTEDH
jgi:RNA polymerase sigma-70 factor (ECF subfamily)